MKNHFLLKTALLAFLCIGFYLLGSYSLAHSAESGAVVTPAGLWRTYDDNDGSFRSIVEIKEDHGKFSGTILKPFLKAGEPTTCISCDGDLKNHPISGFPLFSNLKADDDVWKGGDIVDPKNGKSYSVKLSLEDNGNKLKVRGYLGISLFGRTQYWVRTTADDPSLK